MPQTPTSTTTVAGSDTLTTSATLPAAKLNPAERIAEFEKVILGSKQNFTFGGTVPRDEIDPAKLALYYSADMQNASILRFPATADDLAKFHEYASPSPFGKNEEKVFDDSYRQAREYKGCNIALSSDLVLQSAILTTLAANLLVQGTIEASFNKVNIYVTGGFFKEHRDTPLGRGHIGTLTFCLPSTFTGGELVVTQDDTEVVFDWAKSKGGAIRTMIPTDPSTPSPSTAGEAGADCTTPTLAPAPPTDLITWAFLYSDVCHQVPPITSGTRVTVTYDVWHYNKPLPLLSYNLDIDSNPIKDCLVSLLRDEEHFLPHGGRIAFGTRHGYPVSPSDKGLKHLIQSFKGKDAVLAGLLDLLELDWNIKAVYNVDYEGESDDGHSDDSSSAEVDPNVISRWTVGGRYSCITGGSFEVADGFVEGGDYSSLSRMITREGYGRLDESLIWITKPGEYGHSNGYVAYGNEPSGQTLYIGVAIVVDIPPQGKRERFTGMSGRSKKRKGN